MALFTKPQFNTVWAQTGTKLSPDPAKISQGWVVEIPPHEFDNWIQNRQDALLAHLNQVGVPMWDSTVEYQASKSYVQGSTSGTIYRANTTNTNVNPELDIQGNWSVAFQASGEALLKSQNLADVVDKALARNNLGIPDTAFYDSRYLQQWNNFSDVPNKASARNNIDVYSRAEVISLLDAYAPAGEVTYFAQNSVPPRYLFCDGAAVSRTEYSRLFSAIGTRYGAGNGSTTFNIPNLVDDFIRGASSVGGVGARQSSAAPNIKGQVYGSVEEAGSSANGAFTLLQTTTPGAASGGLSWGFSFDASRSSSVYTNGVAEVRPRNVALLPCIRT